MNDLEVILLKVTSLISHVWTELSYVDSSDACPRCGVYTYVSMESFNQIFRDDIEHVQEIRHLP